MRFYRDLDYEQLVELWRKEELKRRASRPTVLFHNDFTPAVTSYGWALDDGSTQPESTTLAASEDNSYDVDVSSGDVQLFLFLQIEEQGDDSSAGNPTTLLRFDPNGGTSWQTVTASSSGIFGTADGNTLGTNEAAWPTSNFKLTGEEGTAEDGLELTDNLTRTGSGFSFSAANYVEFVFCITVDSANVNDNDTITFAFSIDGTDITNDVTATLTVTKSAGATQEAADALGGGLAATQQLTSLSHAAVAGGFAAFPQLPLFTKAVLAGGLADSKKVLPRDFSALAGGLADSIRFPELSFAALAGGLSIIGSKISKAFSALGGALANAATLSGTLTEVTADAICATIGSGVSYCADIIETAGGLTAKTIKANLSQSALAGGLAARTLKAIQAFAALAGGLADAVVNALGGGVELISAAALAGGLAFRQNKISRAFSALGGGLANVTRGVTEILVAALAGGLEAIHKKVNLLVKPYVWALYDGDFSEYSGDPAVWDTRQNPLAGGRVLVTPALNGVFLVFAALVAATADSAKKQLKTIKGAAGGIGGAANLNVQITTVLSANALGGGLAVLARKINALKSALAGGLVDATATALGGGLEFVTAAALSGGLAAKQITVNLTRSALAGGFVASIRRLFETAAALAGGLSAIVRFPFLAVAALAGGLAAKAVTVYRSFSALAGGLAARALSVTRAFAALAGGLAAATESKLAAAFETAAAVAGALANATVQYIQRFPPFTGHGGFGARPEGKRQWASWRGTWRRKTGREQ